MNVNRKFRSTASIIFILSIAADVSATQNTGDLDGIYNLSRGWAESQEIGASPNPGEPIEQIGRYRVSLVRRGWNQLPPAEKMRIRKVLIISGIFRGELLQYIGQNPLFEHVLGNDDRTGAIYTENDTLVSPPKVVPCGPSGLMTFSGVEQINPIKGIGIYNNLQRSKMLANITVNQCTLQNDIQFIPEVSYLCFEGNTICP